MILLRRSDERGYFNHGWLQTYHSFSFGEYYDPQQMGFGVLRVINQDAIAEGRGFPMHGHRDMEIITYVTEGSLSHRDTLGNSATISPGEVQRMSAGTGIRHSEVNALGDLATKLYQIWILPEKEDIPPSYDQKNFSEKLSQSGLHLVASRLGREGSITLNQDVDLYVGRWTSSHEQDLPLSPDRRGWLQVIKGEVVLSGESLKAGDGAGIEKETNVGLQVSGDTEVLFFNMPY